MKKNVGLLKDEEKILIEIYRRKIGADKMWKAWYDQAKKTNDFSQLGEMIRTVNIIDQEFLDHIFR